MMFLETRLPVSTNHSTKNSITMDVNMGFERLCVSSLNQHLDGSFETIYSAVIQMARATCMGLIASEWTVPILRSHFLPF